MPESFKCPVCGKPLSEAEYDKALGLWKGKQEHIQHLEKERKKLQEKERAITKTLEIERKKLKQQEIQYKQRVQLQAKQFKSEQTKLRRETKKLLNEQSKRSTRQLKEQRIQLQRSFHQKMTAEIKKGVEQGIEEQKTAFKKQEIALRKTKNKMAQLENSFKLSAKKYEQANEEIKKLKEQIEGLLEEQNLLEKLQGLFPNDRFEHPGRGGDIIHFVIEQAKEIGRIVYECKKTKPPFQKRHIEQAKEARRFREADFALLVTNVFPAKKQYYFVEKNVFVVSPVCLEPIVFALRDSLVRMAILKMTNEAKQKAVQKVYDFLASAEYNNKINDIATQLIDLAKDLKLEIKSHRERWEKRYSIYSRLYSDVGVIDFKLRGLVQNRLEDRTKLLPPPKKEFVEIEELDH